MRYYIAYGSNLNKKQMEERCPGAKPVGTAIIEGYTLMFKNNGSRGVLTIEQNTQGKVPVAIWEVNSEHEKKLDKLEGLSNHIYYKTNMDIQVKMFDGREEKLNAFVYIMTEGRTKKTPNDDYFERCLRGYKEFGFDEKYLNDAKNCSKNSN